MSLTQNRNSQNFVDYVPAELKEGKTWLIVYYVSHPITKKLIRKRNRVKPLQSISNRRKLAKQMVFNINQRLASGWNPFFEEKNNKQYKKLFESFDIFIKRKSIEFKDGNIRHDTLRTYKSRIQVLQNFIKDEIRKDLFCFEFNSELINKFLDFIRYEKGNSAKTRDNYLSFCVTLGNFLLEKNYILENPCLKIKKTNRKSKNRILIPNDLRTKIFNHLSKTNENYLTLCLVCYYCLVRRTEITKLKVKNLNLKNNILTIDAEGSKNRKTQNVTIPQQLVSFLKHHIENANSNEYVFSSENFEPGLKKLNPDRITKEWIRLRKILKIPTEIQWYSLKDSGITDLLRAGVPVISVRDQARHYSSKQTDEYTPRELISNDENIKSSNVKF